MSEETINQKHQFYAIGDIHGRADLLEILLKKIQQDADEKELETKTIITLGDFIDRGHDVHGVFELLLELENNEDETVFLLGNHEDLMLSFYATGDKGDIWLANGGDSTLHSYNIATSPHLDVTTLRALLIEKLPPRHLQFLQRLKLNHQTEKYFFVHAGIRPNISIDEQVREDLLWIREPFLSSKEQHTKVVVHGHTIAKCAEIKQNRIGVDTGAYYTNRLSCAAINRNDTYIIHT